MTVAGVSDPQGTVRWFGTTWDALVCVPANHILTPTGMTCARCEQAIEDEDQGVTVPLLAAPGQPWKALRSAWHLDCWFSEIGIKVAAEL